MLRTDSIPAPSSDTRRRGTVAVLASLLFLAACGGDDNTASQSEQTGTVAPAATVADAAPITSDVTATTPATAPAEPAVDFSGSFDAPDDVCTLAAPERLAELLGVGAVVPATIPYGCLWRYGDNDSQVFTIAAIPTQTSGTREEACRARSAVFTDVDELTVAGQPAFAGIDEASTGDTLVVCYANVELVASGDPDRDLLAVLMADILAG